MKHIYPLKLKFKLIALAPRISVTDKKDQEVFYIEQKVLALKEDVKVFNNAKEKKLLYTIKSDQILDFGASYYFRTPDDNIIGSVHQQGMRSLFRASYTISDYNQTPLLKVVQSKPWAALVDSILSAIPFVEFITGYILNPSYNVLGNDDHSPLVRMKKQPSFFESTFVIEPIKQNISDEHEKLILLSLLMIVQLERSRS